MLILPGYAVWGVRVANIQFLQVNRPYSLLNARHGLLSILALYIECKQLCFLSFYDNNCQATLLSAYGMALVLGTFFVARFYDGELLSMLADIKQCSPILSTFYSINLLSFSSFLKSALLGTLVSSPLIFVRDPVGTGCWYASCSEQRFCCWSGLDHFLYLSDNHIHENICLEKSNLIIANCRSAQCLLSTVHFRNFVVLDIFRLINESLYTCPPPPTLSSPYPLPSLLWCICCLLDVVLCRAGISARGDSSNRWRAHKSYL